MVIDQLCGGMNSNWNKIKKYIKKVDEINDKWTRSSTCWPYRRLSWALNLNPAPNGIEGSGHEEMSPNGLDLVILQISWLIRVVGLIFDFGTIDILVNTVTLSGGLVNVCA